MLYTATDLNALQYNANHIKEAVDREIIAVVKHDAYGAGIGVCAPVLDPLVKAFAVENMQEARALTNLGVHADIMVIGPTCLSDFDKDTANIILPLDSLEIIEALANIYINDPLRVQLRVDLSKSGIGVPVQDTYRALAQIARIHNLSFYGMFAHSPTLYLGSDVQSLADVFDDLCYAAKKLFPDACCHLATSASLHQPALFFDAIRVGTGLYGLPSFDHQDLGGLRPVVSLYATLTNVFAPQGDSLSFYDQCVDTSLIQRAGVVPVGYGYLPALIHKKDLRIAVGGRLVSVIGSCAMGHMLVDLTWTPNVQPGDRVTFVGSDGGRTITAASFAKSCDIPICRCDGALLTTARATKLAVTLDGHVMEQESRE